MSKSSAEEITMTQMVQAAHNIIASQPRKQPSIKDQEIAQAVMDTVSCEIAKYFNNLEKKRILFSEAQLRTIEMLDDASQCHLATASQINGLFFTYALPPYMRNIIRELMSLPPTPEGEETDWTDWLLSRTEEKPPERLTSQWGNEKHQPIMIILETAGQRALKQIPHATATAQWLKTYQKKGQDRIELSRVISKLNRIRFLINRLCDEREITPPTAPPAQIASELEQARFKVTRDCGMVLEDLRAIRQNHPADWKENLRITTSGQYWYLSNSVNPDDNPECGISISIPNITEPEELLINWKAPSLPGPRSQLQDDSKYAIRYLARANETTPEGLRAYLRGETEDWHSRTITPCSHQSVCAAPCAQSMTRGNDPSHLPLTDDGTQNTCEYATFLDRYQGTGEDTRSQAATMELKEILAHRNRKTQKNGQEKSQEKGSSQSVGSKGTGNQNEQILLL